MRDIRSLTKEEIEEFLNVYEIGEHKISNFKVHNKAKYVEVTTTTPWYYEDEDTNKTIKTLQKDIWEFYQTYYETTYPAQKSNLLYYEFLLAKGFKDNRFSNDTMIK